MDSQEVEEDYWSRAVNALPDAKEVRAKVEKKKAELEKAQFTNVMNRLLNVTNNPGIATTLVIYHETIYPRLLQILKDKGYTVEQLESGEEKGFVISW